MEGKMVIVLHPKPSYMPINRGKVFHFKLFQTKSPNLHKQGEKSKELVMFGKPCPQLVLDGFLFISRLESAMDNSRSVGESYEAIGSQYGSF
jgi:hypothetical protein